LATGPPPRALLESAPATPWGCDVRRAVEGGALAANEQSVSLGFREAEVGRSARMRLDAPMWGAGRRFKMHNAVRARFPHAQPHQRIAVHVHAEAVGVPGPAS